MHVTDFLNFSASSKVGYGLFCAKMAEASRRDRARVEIFFIKQLLIPRRKENRVSFIELPQVDKHHFLLVFVAH